VRGFIIAKLMPLCGSIGAFKKQQNGNDPVGPTLTADQAPSCTRAGTVAERQIAYLVSTSVPERGLRPCASSS